jgi:hypothetical protein
VQTGEHLVGGGDDRVGFLRLERAQGSVDGRAGALDERQRADELGRHPLARDPEVLEGALRLRAPEARGGHLDLAERVALDPDVGCHGRLLGKRRTKH